MWARAGFTGRTLTLTSGTVAAATAGEAGALGGPAVRAGARVKKMAPAIMRPARAMAPGTENRSFTGPSVP